MREANAQTIYGSINLIEGSRRANILLPEGTKLCINYSIEYKRNLLSFKDICRNGYHRKHAIVNQKFTNTNARNYNCKLEVYKYGK